MVCADVPLLVGSVEDDRGVEWVSQLQVAEGERERVAPYMASVCKYGDIHVTSRVSTH